MTSLGYDDIINGRTNKYETTFFHIYLEGESPITNSGSKVVSDRDYASFVHEYIHYIQQITAPYAIKYNRYFTKRLILLREYIDSVSTISIPVELEKGIQAMEEFKLELERKNGCKDFLKGHIDAIEISDSDMAAAKLNDTAVNIGVYDFDNERAFEDGFKFGYICVMESMAHLIQSLFNPHVLHREVPYQSAQLICNKIRPEIAGDTKLLLSICYVSLFFNNPGHAFFEVLRSANKDESGMQLYRRYMTDHSRTFNGVVMPNYKMMHLLMDDFLYNLETLLGKDLIYMKDVLENCKYESRQGESALLNLIYHTDLKQAENLNELLDFYGIPAIDSLNEDIIVPFDAKTNKPYLETAILLSLELISIRLTKPNKTECVRFPICDKLSREKDIDLIDENCAETQWKKQLPCIFTRGLSYWRMSDKVFEE